MVKLMVNTPKAQWFLGRAEIVRARDSGVCMRTLSPLFAVLVASMVFFATPVRSMRVAIQGSGISAATCAKLLSQNGHDVTVFEAGRGPGGRMSTRRASPTGTKGADAAVDFQWDHGAQYFSPKTEAFARVIDDWCALGFAAAWEGHHCMWSEQGGVVPDAKAALATRYVGRPGMNAIPKGLLEGVIQRFQTRAVARRGRDGVAWLLEHGKTGEPLGTFDFLVCSDKTAAARYRSDLASHELPGFVKPASALKSVPSLVLMAATTETRILAPAAAAASAAAAAQQPLVASLLLDGHSHFAWVARDSSKPGRPSTQAGTECWVAQATPECTQRLLDSMAKKGRVFPNDFRAAVVRELAPPLEALLNELSGAAGGAAVTLLETQGHRWGAAFPAASLPDGCAPSPSSVAATVSLGPRSEVSATASFSAECTEAGPFYLDVERGFGACGDYFSAYPGRVEGGWTSGSALATAILRAVK